MQTRRLLRRLSYAALLLLIIGVALFSWSERRDLFDAARRWQAGPLPEPVSLSEITDARDVSAGPTAAEIEELRDNQPTEPPPTETENIVSPATPAVTQPTPVEPPAPVVAPVVIPTNDLPAAFNLRVPMVYQSPFSEWTAIDEDACEEASMLMVKHYLNGVTTLTRQEMKDQIDAVVAYEMQTFGFFESTTAEQNLRILREYFGFSQVRILPFDSIETVKQELAAGHPVILPANGKLLKNPNFRNGGPEYHMLVIKGYTATGQFITNDPGTRLGADYTYPQERLLEAASDWDGISHADGPKLLIIVDR